MITETPMFILDRALPTARQEMSMKHFRVSTVTTADWIAAKVRDGLADALDVPRGAVTDEATLGFLTEGNPWSATARALAIADIEHEFRIELPDALHGPAVEVGAVVAAVQMQIGAA